MENIVEEVEDKSQNEGSPSNSQRYEDMGRCEVVSSSDSVHQSDVLSNRGHRQSHRCQADWDNLTIEINILTRLIWRVNTMV